MYVIRFFFALAIACWVPSSFARSEDDFTTIKRNSQDEVAEGSAPDWVGAFCSIGPTDDAMYVYTSSRGGFAFRKKSIFGFEKGKVMPITFEAGELRTEISHDEFNCPNVKNPLVVAKVQDCVFLIPMGRVHGFCINLHEGRNLDSYLHTDSRTCTGDLPKTSTVAVPDRYKPLLGIPSFSFPIIRVIQSAKEDNFAIEARIQKESNLYKGMELSCRGAIFEVSEINDDSVIAICKHKPEGVRVEKFKESSLTTSR